MVGVEEGQDRTQVGEVEQREAFRVGVPEDERQGLLLRLVGLRIRARSWGPKSDTVARNGTPGPIPPSDTNSVGKAAGGNAPLGHPLRPARRPSGGGEPGEVGLDVGGDDATPGADSCSAITWRVLVLPVPVAPATRPWRFIILSGTRTVAVGATLPSRIPLPSSRVLPCAL